MVTSPGTPRAPVGPTAPALPVEGLVWINTATVPATLQVFHQGAWVVIGAAGGGGGGVVPGSVIIRGAVDVTLPPSGQAAAAVDGHMFPVGGAGGLASPMWGLPPGTTLQPDQWLLRNNGAWTVFPADSGAPAGTYVLRAGDTFDDPGATPAGPQFRFNMTLAKAGPAGTGGGNTAEAGAASVVGIDFDGSEAANVQIFQGNF